MAEVVGAVPLPQRRAQGRRAGPAALGAAPGGVGRGLRAVPGPGAREHVRVATIAWAPFIQNDELINF